MIHGMHDKNVKKNGNFTSNTHADQMAQITLINLILFLDK